MRCSVCRQASCARIEGIGAGFRAFPPAADLDLSNRDALFPEWKHMPPGPERVRFAMERIYVDAMPAQHEGVRNVLQEFPADVILGDNFLLGVLPMLLGPRSERPPIVLCGTMLLHCRRDDGGPNFAGLPPAVGDAQRAEYAAIAKAQEAVIDEPVMRRVNGRLAALGAEPLPANLFHALVDLPDAYLQLTVPRFELPRRVLPASVHFVGAPPIIPHQAPLPPWASELDGPRKVVLVT
jgi:hypothetical protein